MVLKFLFLMHFVVLGGADESDIAMRIVGGEIANIGEFPYMVSVQMDEVHVCGGTILNNKTVLTAASCTLKGMTVVAGTNELSKENARFKVAEALPHPKYNLVYNDVGLLKIDGHFTFGPRIRPVVLEESRVGNGVPCVSCGWGRVDVLSAGPTKLLRYTRFKTITNEVCHVMYKSINIPIGLQHMCTITNVDKGVCLGDIGGPLINLDDKQIGIVSFFRPCAGGFPDGFARISHFINWINENI